MGASSPPELCRETMVHHLLCAYIGPLSDFREASGRDVCPKCHRVLEPGAVDWEVLTVTVANG